MRTVAFVSALGGVGCTTLVAHSAALLAKRGDPVVALELLIKWVDNHLHAVEAE